MTTTDPVRSYLDDLARMLSDLAPGDRDEVLAGVREHLDASLEGADDEERATAEALHRLGPPQDVAAEARAALGSVTGGTADPVAPRRLPHRAWLATGLVLTALSTVPFTAAAGVSIVVDQVDGAGRGLPFTFPLEPSAVVMVVLCWPLWAAGAVAVVVARRWMPRTWKLLLAAGPVALASTALASLTPAPAGIGPFIGVLVLVAATALVLAGVRTAWREHPAA